MQVFKGWLNSFNEKSSNNRLGENPQQVAFETTLWCTWDILKEAAFLNFPFFPSTQF